MTKKVTMDLPLKMILETAFVGVGTYIDADPKYVEFSVKSGGLVR